MLFGGSKQSLEGTHEITQLLAKWTTGDQAAGSDLFSVLYPELKKIARIRMRSERHDHTLQPSALVNEFFIRIARADVVFSSRAHFLAIASRAMRRILIDYAKTQKVERNDGGIKLELDELSLPADLPFVDALYVDQLLTHLASKQPRCAQVIEMRCFGGLTHGEVAEVLSLDERTVKRDWRFARTWLITQLRKGTADVTGAVD